MIGLPDTIKTMSSVEIAELTAKRHDNVMRVAKKLFDKGIILSPQIEEVFINGKGGKQKRNTYHLNKTESLNLVANLSPEFTAKIIDRWQELESNQPAPTIPQTLPEALRLAASAIEENQALTHQVEELTPKAEFHDCVIQSEDTISVSKAAKIIGTGRNRLLSFMRRNKWVNRYNEPYQTKIDSGHLDVKLGKWRHPEDGLQESITTLITGKGLAKLQRMHRTA